MGELQGRIFGGYQLQEEIGSGGIAEVYRARQASGAGRDVVVKVIFKEFARQPGFARNLAYVTEASTRLASHPHILPLVAHGEEGEYIYLVTPYVKEGTLAQWIQNGGRLGAADAAPFFQQLCDALSYAHSQGVVHGNLKPSNIFLHEGRHVLLGDFGLLWDVRALDPSWSGKGVEAFEYLAPEVFGGAITQAGDIYSVGATLFHSLTGHTPFHMDKLSDLMAAAQQQRPPSLAQEQPPLAPAIPALDPVIAQAMAKRPEERFPAAMLLFQALDATLRQAALQHAQSPQQPMGQWQPMASTPVSAGVFNASGSAPQMPQIAPVFGAPPAQPGALAGLLGADVDSGMEAGGAAFAGGQAFAASTPPSVDPPTMRVPAPGADLAHASLGAFDAPGQPITAPRQPTVGASGALASGALSGGEDFGGSGLMAFDPPDALLDASLRRISQRLPAVQGEGGAEAGAAAGQFSPTELGLPRLTNPALGNLPADWQALLTDDSARRRNDPFAASSGALAPIDSTVLPAAGEVARRDIGSESNPARDRNGWSSSDAARSRGGSNPSLDGPIAPMPPSRRSRQPDFDFEEPVAAPAKPSSRPSFHEDEFNDTLQAQKVWTNGRHAIVRITKRVSAAPLVILLLAVAILLELGGFAVARPDVCVTHACAVVSMEIQKYAPNLKIPGAPAPVTFAPATPKVTATTNGTGSTTLILTNVGSGAITWSGATTLGWFSVSPASGSLAKGAKATLTLTARPNGVAPGSYVAGLIVDAATGRSVAPVALTVTSGPVLSISTPKLSFTACNSAQPLTITNTGAAALTYSASPSLADVLSVDPSSGTLNPGEKTDLSVSLSCSGSTQGQQYAIILVSNGGSGQVAVSYGS